MQSKNDDRLILEVLQKQDLRDKYQLAGMGEIAQIYINRLIEISQQQEDRWKVFKEAHAIRSMFPDTNWILVGPKEFQKLRDSL